MQNWLTMKHTWLIALLIAPFILAPGCGEKHPVDSVRYSPDGTHIAFTYKGSLFVALTYTDAPRLLEPVAEVQHPAFSWSSDSQFVAFASHEAGGSDVWLYNVATKSAKPITKHLAKDWEPVLVGRDGGGQQCMFLSTRSRHTDIWSIDVDGGRLGQLTDDALVESKLSASRDGAMLAYQAADESGAATLTVHWLGTATSTTLAPGPGRVGQVELSPDGKQLAYVGEAGIYVAKIHKKKLQAPELFVKREDDSPVTFGWSPSSNGMLVSHAGRVAFHTQRWFGRDRDLAALDVAAPPAWRGDGKAFAVGLERGVAMAALDEPQERLWLAPGGKAAAWAARLEEGRGHFDTALALAKLAVGAGEPEHKLLAELLLKTGQPKEAMALYEAKVDGRLKLAKMQLAFERDRPRARKTLRRVPQDKRREDWQRLNNAIAEFAPGRAKPKTFDLYCTALAADLMGERGRALDSWEAFARGVGDRSWLARRAGLRMAELWLEVPRDADEAIDAYEDWLDKWPRAPEAATTRLRLARLYEDKNSLDDAAEQYLFAADSTSGEQKVAALLALAKLQAGKLHKPDLAAAAADAAIEEARKLLEKQKGTLCDAWIESVRVRLGKPADAVAAAKRLAALVGEDASVDDEVGQCIRMFDEAKLHTEANEALEALLPLVDRGEVFDTFIKTEDLYLVRVLSAKPFIECNLGHFPPWFDARVKMLLAYMAEGDKPAGEPVERFALQVLAAWRPSGVQDALRPYEEQLEATPDSDDLRNAAALGYYVLGNYCQSRRALAEALTWYEKLAATASDAGMREYAPVLKECRSLLPARNDVVRQWLDAERAAGQGIWLPAAVLREAEARGRDGEQGMTPEWRRLAVEAYKEFVGKHAKRCLADDACLRLAQLEKDRTMKWALRLLKDYPKSRHFDDALALLEESAGELNTPWLAAVSLADLLESPSHKERVAAMEFTIGVLYQDELDRFDLAKPHLARVSREFPQSPQWPEAEKRLALDLFMHEQWAGAAARIDGVRSKRPEFGWVASGQAALKSGEAWERAGDWSKAEPAYVDAIVLGRELDKVKNLELLRRCYARLGPASLDRLHAHARGDLRKLLKHLPPDQAADLVQRYPDLGR